MRLSTESLLLRGGGEIDGRWRLEREEEEEEEPKLSRNRRLRRHHYSSSLFYSVAITLPDALVSFMRRRPVQAALLLALMAAGAAQGVAECMCE